MVVVQRSTVRVGVPRSILHFEFDGAIDRFLRRLGLDVVLSPPTNREIFGLGKRVVLDELCFPIKVFVGHVAWLALQEVDKIVVPTIVGHESNRVFPCHPRSRLADIACALGVCDANRILSPSFRFDRPGLTTGGFEELGEALGFSRVEIVEALTEPPLPPPERPTQEEAMSGPTIGIVGHPYVVEDTWANNHLIQRLESLGCCVLTRNDDEPIDYAPEGTGLHFALAARTLALARMWDRSPNVDGVLFLLPFNCGPDSDIARFLTEMTEKPVLTLVLDELQSSAGMVTRLEAFVDFLTPARQPVGGRVP